MSLLKVYIAGSLAEIEDIRKKKVELIKIGVKPICEWVDSETTSQSGDPFDNPGKCRYLGKMDTDNIDDAQLLIFIGGARRSPGKTTEIGYAIGTGKPIFFIGTPYSVFHHHSKVTHWNNFEEMITWLDANKGIVNSLLS